MDDDRASVYSCYTLFWKLAGLPTHQNANLLDYMAKKLASQSQNTHPRNAQCDRGPSDTSVLLILTTPKLACSLPPGILKALTSTFFRLDLVFSFSRNPDGEAHCRLTVILLSPVPRGPQTLLPAGRRQAPPTQVTRVRPRPPNRPDVTAARRRRPRPLVAFPRPPGVATAGCPDKEREKSWNLSMEMSEDDINTEEYPTEIHDYLAAFEKSLGSVDEMLKTMMSVSRSELLQKLEPLEQAKMDLVSVYTLNSMFWGKYVVGGKRSIYDCHLNTL
ncbi:PREDICTED: uncharacterized protein LOC106901565 [Calidris pugnax]|uniref:uncharacterized protein LOC106901565 n=1 Tax=Calidris pugnax TaxID=198806 RepID=UPI00071D8944|nr:PREDICTED: uncharacterized protein LOC106901565 [Calidris pugnax]